MKRFFSILVLLAAMSLVASAQPSFAKQFKGKPGYSCVTLSKAALRMMPLQDKMGVNVGSVADKLDRLEIVNANTPQASKNLRSVCEQWIETDGFEDFIDVDEEGEQASIFIKTGDEQNVFLMLAVEDGETAVIILYGTMTVEEMRGIVK